MKRNEENFKCMSVSEGNCSEKTLSCRTPIIWHSGKGKTMETEKKSVVARGKGEGVVNRGTQEHFRAMKHFYCNQIMGNTCCDMVVQTQGVPPKRDNLRIKSGFYAMKLCQGDTGIRIKAPLHGTLLRESSFSALRTGWQGLSRFKPFKMVPCHTLNLIKWNVCSEQRKC